MDLVLKLREIRRLRGLSQKDVAQLSGVGEKTISSFETGHRIGSLKLSQLKKMLKAYGLTEAEFFGGMIEKQIAPWELDEQSLAMAQITEELAAMPKPLRRAMVAKFQLLLETAMELHHVKDKRPAYLRENPEWQMLTSRN